jgi:hypothetical protein
MSNERRFPNAKPVDHTRIVITDHQPDFSSSDDSGPHALVLFVDADTLKRIEGRARLRQMTVQEYCINVIESRIKKA